MRLRAIADLIAWLPASLAIARLARVHGSAPVIAALGGGDIDAAAAALSGAIDARLVPAAAAALRWRVAPEPIAVALIRALHGQTIGVPIAAAAVSAYPQRAGPRCAQLRLLSSLGDHDAVRAIALRLLPGVTNPSIAFTLWQALDAARDDLADTARADLFAHAPLGTHWRLRFHEARGDVDAAFGELLAREQAADDASERRSALRDAAGYALAHDRYGRHAPLIARAIAAGAIPGPEWRLRGWQAIAGGRSDPFDDPPLAATQWLVRKHLPSVTRYAPRNGLLMIGNTLGAGGMERVLANTLRSVSDAALFDDLHLSLVRFDPDGPSGFFFPEAGIPRDAVSVLSRTGTPTIALAGLPMTWAPRAQAIHDRVVATRPRIVHAWNDLTGLIAAHAALAAGAPRVIIHIHHLRAAITAPGGMTAAYPSCYRLLLERPEVELLFCSDAAARDYADWWGVPFSPRFRTLRNGIALPPTGDRRDVRPARAALGLAGDEPIVGSAFRFDPVKQPLLWIEAALGILRERPDARFVMLGEGPLLDAARDLATTAGKADRFVFPGQVRDVGAWIAALDLFMMTSAIEGLGNGAIEAQFAGVPLVAFNVGGVAETILPGETGWLAPPNDVAALAAFAVAALSDPGRLARIGPIAAAHACERFGMDRYMRELLGVYGAPAG